MATNEIEKVLTMIQGIRTSDAELATKYINPAKYIEHNPFSADGIDGLRHYIRRFPDENYHLKVLRIFQDGPYVFTQEEGHILGRSVFFDIFRFEDDLIVEHWVFSAKGEPPNQSGHTQSDGPTQSKPTEDKETNKSFMREYYETVHIAGNHSQIPKYFSGNHCIRHEPGVQDGVEAFIRDVDAARHHRTIDAIKYLFGQDDFVFVAAKGSLEGHPCVYVDLYRVENEKIAEHWGIVEKLDDWKNPNRLL
jgi:predicted SnoaL-like aldol condensation-catalyzing enzyme